MSNTLHLTTLEQSPRRHADILTSHRKRRREIAEDRRYSESYRAELLSTLDAETRAALADLRTKAQDAAQRVRESLAKPADSRSTDEQIRDELRAERHYRRLERRLDAGHDPLAIIQEAAKAKDRAVLAVLRDELPSYMAAKGQGEQAIQGVLEYLAQAETPLLTDSERASRDLAARLERAESFANGASNWTAYELDGQGTVSVLGVSDGSVITVGE